MKQLVKKIKLQYTLELLTGLHIGGNSENVEIGGIDLPVIKLAIKNNEPYIPGSSLKGKLRCLLEQVKGDTEVGECIEVNNLFGIIKDRDIEQKDLPTDKRKNKPSKLIVRDAMLDAESEKLLFNSPNLDMPYTEAKWENTIKRVEGTAEHPRQIERVPAGAKFNVEFVINVWDTDNEEELIGLLKKGIRLLENDYLGGSGSRGYGQVRFIKKGEPIELSPANDWKEKEA